MESTIEYTAKVSERTYASNGGVIVATDEKAYNNYHDFQVYQETEDSTLSSFISFQKGPIKEVGINGITERDLLEILRFRLENFQNSEFASDYNAKALDAINTAIESLDARTKDREKRGVEGTNQK